MTKDPCDVIALNPFIRRVDHAIKKIMGDEIERYRMHISINREKFVQRCAILCFIQKRKEDEHTKVIRSALTNLELFGKIEAPQDPNSSPDGYA